MKKILITGAASAIAQACARRWAPADTAFFLVDRRAERLNAVAGDLRARGAAQVETAVVDLGDFSRHEALLTEAVQKLQGIDLVFVAHGTLPNQAKAEADWTYALQELTTNTLSVLSLLTHVANYLAEQHAGTIAVISSVAGDRGRQSNYLYGTAKGSLTIFLQGLRNRLAPLGVRVVTIKPGFVDTPMTAEFKKGWLWVKPDAAARGIDRAIQGGRDVVYVLWFWRYIMLAIRLIPERIFKQMKL